MTKYNIALGTLFDNEDFSLVAFYVIRSAVENGWTDVDFEQVEQDTDFAEPSEYLISKRDEAISWLNQNCVADNVAYEYFETIDDSNEEDVPLAVFGLYDKEK